jgi:diguanylate cyclase (GGDEF)-like protein
MQKPSDQPRRGHASALWPIATSIIATLAILGIATALMFELRTNVGVRAKETSENILRLIERDIARNIAVVDVSLRAVAEGLRRPEIMNAPADLRDRLLFGTSQVATGIGALAAVDAEGRVQIASKGRVGPDLPSVAEREYFQAHLLPGEALHVSRPHHSRLLDSDVVAFSRRITNPDGSFGGVTLGSIEVAYFAELLSRLRLGDNGVVTLFRTDGAVLFRQTAKPQPRMTSISAPGALERVRQTRSGTFVGTPAADGVERMYTFTRVGDLPLVVSVGVATEDIYDRFRTQASQASLILFVICTGLIALTIRLTRELRRREAAERALVMSNTELARLSLTDSLTALGNRRAFDVALGRDIRHAKRTRRKLSLLLIDVDHFKSYNDRYGHQQGDAALTSVARILAECCQRPADGAYRLGGEEFALILPETGTDGAVRVSERIRTAVRRLGQAHAGSPFGLLTVSIGYAEIHDEDPASAYERTDAALYAAKQGGRDRACPGAHRLIAA